MNKKTQSYLEVLEQYNKRIGTNWNLVGRVPVVAGWYKCRIKKPDGTYEKELYLIYAQKAWWTQTDIDTMVTFPNRLPIECCGPAIDRSTLFSDLPKLG